MCLLTFIPGGVQPELDALSCGADVNPDGHGWAIVAGQRLLVGHGMNPAETIASFAEARGRHPDGPALFHSRYATAGRVNVDNCHPFAVGGDPRTVLAHNGVLPASVQPSRGERRSDTRIAAEDFLPRFGSLRSRAARLRFEKWMTLRNKIVILTVDGPCPLILDT
jgi:predicted glutamine amidotransferase